MRYILDELGGAIEYGRYFEYLQTIRARLPPHVYRFASDIDNFSLSSHVSLHDAWLEFLSIVEPAEGERHELRRIDIRTCYLGPFHDKKLHINYMDVVRYSIETPATYQLPPSSRTGHGDLITHEIRLDNDTLVHELIFSRGTVILVGFRDFQHEVRDA